LNEDRDLLHYARVVGAFVLVALIIFVVVIDRIGPIISPDYVGIGDAALGLLLGALFALVGVQGFDYWRDRQ
jgi:uncharacterized membrane protein required for colicin V production